jgi:hypothetical protein
MTGTTNQSNTMMRLNKLIAVSLIGFGLTAASSYGTTFDWSFVYPSGHKVSGQLDGDMNTSTGVMHVDNVTNVTVFIDGLAIGGPIVVAASPVVSIDPMQCNFNFQPSAGGTFEIVPMGSDVAAITETWSTDTPPNINIFWWQYLSMGGVWSLAADPGLTPPTVAIITPDNTVSCECAEVTLKANASKPQGSITNVLFYLNTSTLLASLTNAPYLLVASLPLGTNAVTAVATDNFGLSSTSAVVHIVITATPTNQVTANLWASSELKLCFRGVVNSNYVFESTTNLSLASAWTPFATNTADASGLVSQLETIHQPTVPTFYRVRHQP